jgi:hypothetical protein
MPRATNRLTPKLVNRTTAPGHYADGQGLYLLTTNGGKRWVFIFRWKGRRREMGLGSVCTVSLERARELAAEARSAVAAGRDPIAERDPTKSVAQSRRHVDIRTLVKRYIKECDSEADLYEWRRAITARERELRDTRHDLIGYKPQPEAEQWTAKCSCGWTSTASASDHEHPESAIAALDRDFAKHLTEQGKA